MTKSSSVRHLGALLLLGAVLASPLHAVKRRAFVTSVAGTGQLSTWADAQGQSGLAAGDAVCRTRAAAAGLPNPGSYYAWLSSPATDAYCHVQGLTGKKATGCGGAPQPGAGPWYQRDGASAFAGSLSELTGAAGRIFRPIELDELGASLPMGAGGEIWTGTLENGEATTSCQGWTSSANGDTGTYGVALGTARLWTYWSGSSCDGQRRLLCVEPGPSEPVAPGWLPAALVFVTSAVGTGDLSSWPQAGGQTGLAAGDRICRDLAAAAHLPAPDSFVAWLSTVGVDAIDRLSVSPLVSYRRVDGFGIGNRLFLTTNFAQNSIHVDERGHYLGSDFGRVYTGTAADGGLATAGACDDWTSADWGAAAEIGCGALGKAPNWTEDQESACGAPGRLYCFSNVVTLFWDGFDATGDTSRWSSAAP